MVSCVENMFLNKLGYRSKTVVQALVYFSKRATQIAGIPLEGA